MLNTMILDAQGLVEERDMRTRSSDDSGAGVFAYYPASDAAPPSGRPSLDVLHSEAAGLPSQAEKVGITPMTRSPSLQSRCPGHFIATHPFQPLVTSSQGNPLHLGKHLQQLQQQTLDCVQQLQDVGSAHGLSGPVAERVLDTLLALQREVDILHKGNTSLRSSLSALRRSSLETQPQHQQRNAVPGSSEGGLTVTTSGDRSVAASAELRQREAAIE